MRQGKASTQTMLGIQRFSRNGLLTDGRGEIVFFRVQPSNLSVLSASNVYRKICHLMHLFSMKVDFEMVCLDAKENFESNRLYLGRRIERETNENVRALLEEDLMFLDGIQTQMATAREFLLAVRVKNEADERSATLLDDIEKSINEQGLQCVRADREDIKRLLCRYFCVNADEALLEDYDGEAVLGAWFSRYRKGGAYGT